MTKLFAALAITLLLLLPVNAQKSTPKTFPLEVETVLKKSVNNRVELEKFLDFYRPFKNKSIIEHQDDSLKWKAACYLISNMDIHYSETFYWADSLQHKVEFDELSYPNYSLSKIAFNELNVKSKLHPVKAKVYDMHHIKADFLIQNMETAFAAWRKPNCRYLNFDEFCEYLLPYRSLTEKLENWRTQFADTFKIKDQDLIPRSVASATNQLSQKIGGYFASSFSFEEKNNPTTFLSPSQLLFRKLGHCEDIVNLTNLVFKSQGLPCRIEMIPYHATSTGRHYWNATINENHEAVPFEGSKSIEEFKINREPSKVVSFTYAKQKDVPSTWVEESEIPNNYLRLSNFKDVTELYWRTKDIQCTLLSNKLNKKLAYICVFNGLQWSPAYWGKIVNYEVTFPKMCCGVVYLPMLYMNGKLIPGTYPVVLTDSKEEQTLKPNKDMLHTVVLNEQEKYLKYRQGKKYKLYYWDNKWQLISEQVATDQTQLTFKNVPTNALLLMVPEYSARKERPFTITDTGERQWW